MKHSNSHHSNAPRTKRRGILYIRVSSEDQVDGTSLRLQEREGKRYFNENQIELVAIFREEGQSAKTSNRKEFLRAIEFCRKHRKKEPIDVFVVYRMDRFARNVEDHMLIRRKLLNYKTTLVSITEPTDNSPMGKVLETMLAAFAQFDNDLRSQRSSDGLLTKLREGIWPLAPFAGYISSQCKKRGIKKVEPDSPHQFLFPILQKGLKRFAKGAYKTCKALERDFELWGLSKYRGKKTDSKFVYHIMDDRHLAYYAGLLIDPITKEYIKGKHKKMITVNEMHRIKFLRDKRRVQPATKTVFREPFPLRQVVKCSACNMGLTSAFSQGRNKKYPYYSCWNKKCAYRGKSIPSYKLHIAFEKCLKSIIPTDEFWKAFKLNVLKRWEQEHREYHKAQRHFDAEIKQLSAKLDRLYDAYLEGIFSSKEDYFNKKGKLETQISVAKIAKSENHIEELNLEIILIEAETYAKSLTKMWQDLVKPESRSKFLSFVFPGGLNYDLKSDTLNHELGYLFKFYKENFKSGKNSLKNSRSVPLTGISLNLLLKNIECFIYKSNLDHTT